MSLHGNLTWGGKQRECEGREQYYHSSFNIFTYPGSDKSRSSSLKTLDGSFSNVAFRSFLTPPLLLVPSPVEGGVPMLEATAAAPATADDETVEEVEGKGWGLGLLLRRALSIFTAWYTSTSRVSKTLCSTCEKKISTNWSSSRSPPRKTLVMTSHSCVLVRRVGSTKSALNWGCAARRELSVPSCARTTKFSK